MFSYFDYVVYDMFARNSNEFLSLIQPHRNVLVVDQLVYTRHMWSDTLNKLTTDSEELKQFLLSINKEIAKSYRQYEENIQEKNPLYFLREFKNYQFSNFLDNGRQFYREKIQAIEKYKKDQQEKEEQTTNNPELYKEILEIKIQNNIFKNIKWEKVSYLEIKDRAENYAAVYKKKVDIKLMYQNKNLIQLQKQNFQKIINSKNWKTNNIENLISTLGLQQTRKYIENITRSKIIKSPVLFDINDQLHLITDDETLMMCRGLDIPIQAIILEL